MPVRLDKIPAPAQRPALPHAWLWFGLLVLLLLLGMGLTLWLGSEMLTQEPGRFWLYAVAVQAIQASGRPQFIFSGEGTPESGLWCTTIRPLAAKDSTQASN